jgi:hypothetical protein
MTTSLRGGKVAYNIRKTLFKEVKTWIKNLSAPILSHLKEFLASEEVISSFRIKDKAFTRRRKLLFWRVTVLILADWKMSIQNSINKFFPASLGSRRGYPLQVLFAKLGRR